MPPNQQHGLSIPSVPESHHIMAELNVIDHFLDINDVIAHLRKGEYIEPWMMWFRSLQHCWAEAYGDPSFRKARTCNTEDGSGLVTFEPFQGHPNGNDVLVNGVLYIQFAEREEMVNVRSSEDIALRYLELQFAHVFMRVSGSNSTFEAVGE